MENYVIENSTNNKVFVKKFNDSSECYHWVVNHLDLSLNWTYDRLNYLIENGLLTTNHIYKVVEVLQLNGDFREVVSFVRFNELLTDEEKIDTIWFLSTMLSDCTLTIKESNKLN
jgi:hypothetical protein